MVNFFKFTYLNRIFLYNILATFPVAVLIPPPAYAQINQGINEIAFAAKMERLTEKLWKYKEKKDSNKLLDTMLDMKLEVEHHTGNKFDLEKEINKSEYEIKKQGIKVPKKDFQIVRKAIIKKEKKANQRALCMACYFKECPSINFEEYETIYLAAHGDKNQEEQDVKELPLRLTIGITMILAGGFLCFTRIPACVTYGQQIAAAGVTFAIEGYVNRKDEDNKNHDK